MSGPPACRRRLLAAVGTALAGASAGCASRRRDGFGVATETTRTPYVDCGRLLGRRVVHDPGATPSLVAFAHPTAFEGRVDYRTTVWADKPAATLSGTAPVAERDAGYLALRVRTGFTRRDPTARDRYYEARSDAERLATASVGDETVPFLRAATASADRRVEAATGLVPGVDDRRSYFPVTVDYRAVFDDATDGCATTLRTATERTVESLTHNPASTAERYARPA